MEIFDGLSADQIARLRGCSNYMEFDPGQIIFREGDSAFGLYVIINGTIRIYKETPNGKKTLAHLGRDEIFGELGLIQANGKRTATAIAEERSTAFAIPGNPIKFFESIGDWGATLVILKNLIGVVSERLRIKDEEQARKHASVPSLSAAQNGEIQGILEDIRRVMPAESRDRFLTERNLRDDEGLFREGWPSDGFYYLEQGKLKIIKKRPGGGFALLCMLQAPAVLGELGFFGDKSRSATVLASGPARVVHFSSKEFRNLEVKDPKAAAQAGFSALKLAVIQFIHKENALLDAEV